MTDNLLMALAFQRTLAEITTLPEYTGPSKAGNRMNRYQSGEAN